ncbi:VCBS repeat-containing protein [Isosphaeraceae bacterium EP7]
MNRRLAAAFALALMGAGPAFAGSLKFDRFVLDESIPDGYQVEVADVNGDGKPDVVGLGGGTSAWYENPSWTKHIITSGTQTPGIISTATADLDGDGRAEVAIAYEFSMNDPTRGKLGLATQKEGPDGGWSFRKLADLGSIHRLRSGNFGDGPGPTLVVAPIFGRSAKGPAFDQEGATLRLFRPRPGQGEVEWAGRTLEPAFPVMHAIDVIDYNGDGRSDILTASQGGVSRVQVDRPAKDKFIVTKLAPGAPQSAPRTGSSEVHLGRMKGGRRFLATIEPWHGTEVVICPETEPGSGRFGERQVLDASLVDGHALWVADVDRDGDDEIFAGFRGKGTSVFAYDWDGKAWTKTVVDAAIAAQDLRGGDLDGDGTPDVVAIGGKTHNLVWYKPLKAEPTP